jgi:ammonia channel protein AmtB
MFILWFCWFGFNGGSSLSLSTDASMTMTVWAASTPTWPLRWPPA